MNVAFNDCIRFVHNFPRYRSVYHLNASLLGLKLDAYYDFRIILKLFNIIHGKCPNYLREMLRFARSPRGLKLILPRFEHTIGERSYFVQAIRLWNNLPQELHSITSPATFRRKLFLALSNQS